MTKVYIFLDVDGVLNTSEDWGRKLYSLSKNNMDAFGELLCKLNDVQIVLSSTWRNGIARDGSTATHIDDLLAALSSFGVKTLDRTATSPDGIRSKEIDYYLRRHEVDKYIILDDDETLFEMGKATMGLYLVNPKTGLTKADVKKIVALLKK